MDSCSVSTADMPVVLVLMACRAADSHNRYRGETGSSPGARCMDRASSACCCIHIQSRNQEASVAFGCPSGASKRPA